jgi:DNA-binding transcriptional MerR regulator
MPTAPLPKAELPPVPAKRYFTIGEVSELCAVKQHVLRYWEQEFTQLKPMKRRGNRRYYQHHEVMLIRRIRSLLYDEGFTISGARLRLETQRAEAAPNGDATQHAEADATPSPTSASTARSALRAELAAISSLLAATL